MTAEYKARPGLRKRQRARVALISQGAARQYPAQMSRLVVFLFPLGIAVLPVATSADVAQDLASCVVITDDSARLACFDDLAARIATDGVKAGDAAAVLAALDREFRFDRSTRIAPLRFRLNVSQYLSVSRATGPGRDVERLARRINEVIGDIDGWTVEITVHGARVKLPRAQPLTGEELFEQASRAMARSGLPEDRFEIILGPDAEPALWDDGRVRDSNEHIIVEVAGL